MLDRAEDPEKMIKLMIREMEDTLVELKAACAGVMAESKKVRRGIEAAEARINYWEDKAALAVRKDRDDLARQALFEKRKAKQSRDALAHEIVELDALVTQYQTDIRQLEDKLKSARERQRLLVQRHIHARRKRRAQQEIRRMESQDVRVKFEELEARIDRMETEAELINFPPENGLDKDFENLTGDDDIEAELDALKTASPTGDTATPQS
jgi:phage shock protein A